eukprot:213940-Rhodomonas_salina.1
MSSLHSPTHSLRSSHALDSDTCSGSQAIVLRIPGRRKLGVVCFQVVFRELTLSYRAAHPGN